MSQPDRMLRLSQSKLLRGRMVLGCQWKSRKGKPKMPGFSRSTKNVGAKGPLVRHHCRNQSQLSNNPLPHPRVMVIQDPGPQWGVRCLLHQGARGRGRTRGQDYPIQKWPCGLLLLPSLRRPMCLPCGRRSQSTNLLLRNRHRRATEMSDRGRQCIRSLNQQGVRIRDVIGNLSTAMRAKFVARLARRPKEEIMGRLQ